MVGLGIQNQILRKVHTSKGGCVDKWRHSMFYDDNFHIDVTHFVCSGNL